MDWRCISIDFFNYINSICTVSLTFGKPTEEEQKCLGELDDAKREKEERRKERRKRKEKKRENE